MNAEHTPGPFPLSIESSGEQFIIMTNQWNLYAKTFDPGAARLIVSAPDLLHTMRIIHANAAESPEWIRARIDAVISKVERGEA